MAKDKEPTITDLSPQEFLELMIYANTISSREEGVLLKNISNANSINTKRDAKRLANEFFRGGDQNG